MIKKYFCIVSVFLNFLCFSQNKNEIDSLLSIIKKTNNDSIKVQCFREISWQYEGIDYDKGLKFAMEAYLLAKKNNKLSQIAACLTDVGIIHEYIGNPDSALYYYDEAGNIFQQIGDEDGVCVVYINSASTYRSLGKFSEALQKLFAAIRIAEKLNDKDRQASCMIIIGNIYRQKNQFEVALKYNYSAYDIYLETGDLKGQAIALSNNGIIYSEQKNHPKALECYFKALEMRESLGLVQEVASSYSSIGCEYLDMEDLTKALQYNEKAFKINKEINNKKGQAIDLTNLAAVYTKQKNYHDALENLLVAEKYAEEIKFKNLLNEVYIAISKNYEYSENYKSSLSYLNKYIELKDVLFNERENEIIAEAASKYELDKKNSQILLLNQAKEMQDSDLKRKSIIIWSGLICLVLVTALAFYIFRSYKEKQKANDLITQKKLEVEQQKEIVEEKQKEILDSIYYAKRIQQALLPTDRYIDKYINRLNK